MALVRDLLDRLVLHRKPPSTSVSRDLRAESGLSIYVRKRGPLRGVVTQRSQVYVQFILKDLEAYWMMCTILRVSGSTRYVRLSTTT